MNNTFLLIILILGVFALIFLLSKLNLSEKTEKWIKLILFASGAVYVMSDLFAKEKYALFIALFFGSVVFVYILFYAKKK